MGMNRILIEPSENPRRVPRVYGDEPDSAMSRQGKAESSPFVWDEPGVDVLGP